jgi:hypothetical protein
MEHRLRSLPVRERPVQITVGCPKCETKYHLDPELRGQRMRCPNAQCRAVFEVRPLGEAPPAELPRRSEGSTVGPAAPVVEQTSGNVGDMVPILPAEAAAPDNPVEGSAAETLHDAPTPPSLLPDAPLQAAEAADMPAEKAWHEPPPARRPPPPASRPPLPKTPPPATRAPAPPPPAPVVGSPPAARPRPRKATPAPIPPKPAPPSWQDAPPPVRHGAALATTARDTQHISPADTDTVNTSDPNLDSAEEAVLRELGPGEWDAPPTRESASDDADAPTSSRGGKLKWLMAGMALVAACVAIGVGVFVLWHDANSETERFRKGLEAYTHHQDEKAAVIFSGLVADFPDSENKETHDFLRDWSHLRSRLFTLGGEPANGIGLLNDFVRSESKNPVFAKYKDDVSAAYVTLFDDLLAQALRDLKPDFPDEIERLLDGAASHIPADRLAALKKQLGGIRVAVVHKLLREEVLTALQRLLDNPVNDMIELARKEIAEAKRELPNLDKDPEVQKRMAQILEARRALVQWKEAVVPLEAATENGEPALWVTSDIAKVSGPAAARGHVVFALARGVLYALDQDTGQVRWATRVGVDTTALPVRISGALGELALVLSSDTNTLTVREVRTGKPIWRHRLSAPCLGRPLVIDQKAYLPTYDGRVYEIDLGTGQQLGWFDLGKPLSVGGARQEGTNLLYFPADERYIFVLDVAERLCPALLLSDHPAGSLRSEPVIISRADQRKVHQLEESAFPDYLVLSQASNLDSMKLRVFALPIKPGVTTASALGAEPEVHGWSWFPPFQNCERLVQVTDEGVIGLIGINQYRNHDRDLFLETKFQIPPGKADERRGRAQVAHASEDDVWVLARGGLRLWHYNRFDRAEQNLLPVWQQPLNLGSPLHASQVDEGRSLVLVTQSVSEPICKATAVSPAADRDAGVIQWQKQLGLLCRGEPVTIAGQVLMLDQGGGLFRFDPKDHADDGTTWGGAGELVAPALASAARGPYLLPSDDGKALDILALSPLGRPVLRHYEPGKKVENRSYLSKSLPSTAPARIGSGLVLALEDGLLLHLPREGKGVGDTGPEWRARHADRDAPGFVASLGGDEFVATDGSRGLTRWRWGGARDFEKRTASEDLPARIVTTPLVLPSEKDGSVRVCVADARGVLTLLHDTAAGGKGWTPGRSWALKGRITAGPFLRGSHVGCVLDRRRLVWIDPSKDSVAWEYHDANSVMVGTPQMMNNELIVALQSGKFVALDPATGKTAGGGYRLKANVAPLAAPVPFGKDRLLAPLSDGTLMILNREQLGAPARE